MRWMLAIVVVAFARPARADAASVASATLFTAAEVSLALDAMQTLDVRRYPGKETNPIMGGAPSKAVVLGYFGVIAAGQGALYLWGPRWLSNTISTATLIVQVPTISRNFSLGYTFRLP